MVICEITGKETKNPVKIQLAGSILTVDRSQQHLGKLIEEQKRDVSHTFYKSKKKQEEVGDVVSNYFSLISKALAQKQLTAKHAARAVNIKESTLQKYVSGKLKPDTNHAKILEKFLGITLFEEHKESKNESFDVNSVMTEESSGNTLGDLIKDLK